jgi:diacylglycerol kinase (ATP)
VIRAGLIWNRNSHRNRGADRAPLPADVIDIVPEEASHLSAGLRRLAGEGVELVVVDGGDGTIREVVSRLPEAFGPSLPRLSVLPNGKTNALALDIETPLGTRLDQILAAAEAGRPTKRRACLEILREGSLAPERRGFLFGAGAFVRATDLAQRNHGLGLFDNAAVAVTLAGAVLGTLLGGADSSWRRGELMTLSPEETEARARFLMVASTLKRFPLGLKPFGPPREGLKTLTVSSPPRAILAALPRLIRGEDDAWLAARGYLRRDLESLSLNWPGRYVLDGEVYDGGALTLRRGVELEFVVP